MREIYPPPFGHLLLQGGTVLRTFPLVNHGMGEISSPSFERPLFQGGALLRIFPFWVFHFTNLTPMDEVFLFFLVLNSTYGQSFAFCLFSCFFPVLPFYFSSFSVFFTPTFNRIIEALIFLLYNNFSIERGCLLWNQPREPVLMASQQVTTEIRGMPSLPIRFAIRIFS